MLLDMKRLFDKLTVLLPACVCGALTAVSEVEHGRQRRQFTAGAVCPCSLACRQSLLCVTVTAAAAAWPRHGDKNHLCRWISHCVSRVSGTKSRSRPSTSRSRLTATSLLNLVPISLTTRRKRLEEGNRNSHLSAIWLVRGALTLPLPRPRQAEPRTAAPVGGTRGAGPSR